MLCKQRGVTNKYSNVSAGGAASKQQASGCGECRAAAGWVGLFEHIGTSRCIAACSARVNCDQKVV